MSAPGVRTVLVVDDSAVVRLAVSKRLRSVGLAVVEQATAAPPGPEVIASIACALLDLDLDDEADGVDVARALRAARLDVPIAFFSATTSDERRARAAELGPVFAKPDALDAAVAWALAAAG